MHDKKYNESSVHHLRFIIKCEIKKHCSSLEEFVLIMNIFEQKQ